MEINEDLEKISTEETDSDNLAKSVMKHLNVSSESEAYNTKTQTYSEVAAMPVKQDVGKTQILEHFVPVVEKSPFSYSNEKMQKAHPEKQSSSRKL